MVVIVVVVVDDTSLVVCHGVDGVDEINDMDRISASPFFCWRRRSGSERTAKGRSTWTVHGWYMDSQRLSVEGLWTGNSDSPRGRR